MRRNNVLRPAYAFALFCPFLLTLYLSPRSAAQAEGPSYVRKNSFGIVAAYSNDSSHMLLGGSENRKLLDFGISYDRKLYASHWLNWQFDAEYLPIAYDSDPVQITVFTATFTNPPFTETSTQRAPTLIACHPSSGSQTSSGGITYSFIGTCSRRWVIGQAMSPFGFRWNFEPRHRLQPFAVGHGGYMYSSQTIPVDFAGAFNFTFDFGAGVEFFSTRAQSLRAEYRFHHISNHDTADMNPGIDNKVLQLSWTFGR